MQYMFSLLNWESNTSSWKTIFPSIAYSWGLQYDTVKNCEGSEILPDLQASELACLNLTDAGRKHYAPELEREIFNTQDAASSVSLVLIKIFCS